MEALSFAQQLRGAVVGVQHTIIMHGGRLVHTDCTYIAVAPLLGALASVGEGVSAGPVHLRRGSKEERLYLAVCQVWRINHVSG